jgi:hypothetical protein
VETQSYEKLNQDRMIVFFEKKDPNAAGIYTGTVQQCEELEDVVTHATSSSEVAMTMITWGQVEAVLVAGPLGERSD